jgi:hypothetical protein
VWAGPWSGRPPTGGLTQYIDSIRSNDSPFMIPLPFSSISNPANSSENYNSLGRENQWPYMYVLGGLRPCTLNYPGGLVYE